MDRIVIVHFQPLEKYPPVMNMLRHLARENNTGYELHAISTEPEPGKKKLQVPGVTIHRVASWKKDMGKWQRMWLYLQFNIKTLFLLLKYKPGKLVYFETLSSGGPYFYKTWFNRHVQLYIHYHEYTSVQEYQEGMVLSKWLYRLEKKLFKKAVWVSHTNIKRAELFVRDAGSQAPLQVELLPNYPPKSWQMQSEEVTKPADGRIGFVYVGALSMETMFVEDFVRFIGRSPDRYYWDIYSDNFSEETIAFIRQTGAVNIHFKGGVGYDSLPAILPQYHIGVILYKGHIPNYVHNAPNKLFEYLACGLDVWFPREMTGSEPYITENTLPSVRQVNFRNLEELDVDSFFNRTRIALNNTWYCENSLALISKKLLFNAG